MNRRVRKVRRRLRHFRRWALGLVGLGITLALAIEEALLHDWLWRKVQHA